MPVYFHNALGESLVNLNVPAATPNGAQTPYTLCHQPWVNFTLDFAGRVVGCCRDLRSEHILGNLLEESADAIWNGERMVKLRRALVDKRLSWIALWHLVSGRRKQTPREQQDVALLHPLPADLRKVWDHIGRCFVLAVTFNNFLIGAIVRRLFLWLANGRNDESDSRRATAVVQDLVILRSA